MKKKLIMIGGGAAALIAVLLIVAMRGRGEKPTEVQTSKVERQKIVQKVNATGKIQPRTQVKISADVSAKITKLSVVEGQWVQKGQFLVELDRERYLAAVESAHASVSSAEANAALVRQNMDRSAKELKRSQELLSQGLESQSVFETKQTEAQVEVARHKSALEQVVGGQSAHHHAPADLKKTTIYAPMAGIVSELNKEVGEIALGSQFQADVIMVIADLSEMEAQVNVDENDITSLSIGAPAEIQVDALIDTTLHGTIREISSSANATGAGTTEQKTEFEITIAISDAPKTLRPGMTATADILAKTNDRALSVPLQSVAVRTVDQLSKKGEKRKDAEGHFKADKDGFVEVVFRLEQGKAVAKQVETGIQSDERIEILAGLQEGDEVVSGSYRAISKDLANGAVVKINNEKKPDASLTRKSSD
jgi:HlyD family secretion protein